MPPLPLDPIFILAPVWRSGSTLVQRIVNSFTEHDGRPVVIWGEHGKGRKGLVTHLLEAWRGFKYQWESSGEAQNRQRIDGAGDFWMANMCPYKETVSAAMRGFLLSLYGTPKTGEGTFEHVRWGFKEVRYGQDEIRFLAGLFPAARFVFVVRKPLDTVASYASTGWKETGLVDLAEAWARNAAAYLALLGDPDLAGRASWISYERIDTEKCMELARFLGLVGCRERIEAVRARVLSHFDRVPIPPAVWSGVEQICEPTARLIYGKDWK